MNLDISMIDKFVSQVSKLLPDDPQKIRAELNQVLKTTLVSSFKDMHLVTREEYDVQAKLLAKTRAKLDELQSRLEQLEQTTENQ